MADLAADATVNISMPTNTLIQASHPRAKLKKQRQVKAATKHHTQEQRRISNVQRKLPPSITHTRAMPK
jgi:hypothetical protein